MTRDSAARTSAAATTTTTRPRLVSRSGAFAAWPRVGSKRAAWLGTGESEGAVQRTAARLRALSWGNADGSSGNSGSSGSSSARIALMTTSAAQTFIRAILLTMSVLGPLLDQTCARSNLCSIVRPFDRKIYYIVVSRRSDIFATRPNRCLGYETENVSL